MTDSKKTRKELLKKEDAFIAAAGQSALWIKHHRKIVFGGTALLALVVAASWGTLEYLEARRLEASRLYAEALELHRAEIAIDPAKADPSADPPIFASEQERNQTARSAFERVVGAGSVTGVADLARFYVADLDVELGELDRAVEGFRELADDLSPDDSLYFLAVERAAYLLERKEDASGAIQMWQRLTGSAKRFYADRALYQLARLHAEKGEIDRARELLGRLEKDFPSSSVRPKVEELYARVGRPDATAATAAQGGTEPRATP